MATTELEVELSRFAAGLNWDDIPTSVQASVLDIWLDAVANALTGRRAMARAAVEKTAGLLNGGGSSTILGGGTTAMTSAAFINGYQITAFTMCDVYRPALCHITPEVVPAVLALAERDQVPGATFLAALTVGLEVTARLGAGVDYPQFRANGWHAPGVIGTVGAAAAAARVLGLDDRHTRQAIGLGVSQAAGTFAAIGTPAVKFHQARGAVSALWAAAFTAEGTGGPEHALTHPDGGLFSTYAGSSDPDGVLDGIGERWKLEQISLRRWPAASSLQSLVDCMVAAETSGLAGVESVEVTLPPASYELCGAMGWDDQLSAMQSARYVAAVVLSDGQCWLDQFTDERRVDRDIDRFARTGVTVRCDPDLPPSGAHVRIRKDGATRELRCDTAPGDPARPLTRAEVIGKLARAASGASIMLTPDELAETMLGTAISPDVSDLCAVLRAGPEPAHERTDRDFARRD